MAAVKLRSDLPVQVVTHGRASYIYEYLPTEQVDEMEAVWQAGQRALAEDLSTDAELQVVYDSYQRTLPRTVPELIVDAVLAVARADAGPVYLPFLSAP